ncbi:MAG: hypothetical protein Q9220_004934 [cf. Caloplaca sp. 1 TL-2023]
MASRPTSSRVPTGTAANPVRRNLFHGHHLIRRPTGASSLSVGSTTTSNAAAVPEIRQDDSSDIIMRDQSGKPQYEMPQVLPIDEELPYALGRPNEALLSEKERMEEKMLNTWKTAALVSGDRMELYPAVLSSLRRKVAALDEDNWMFEAEEVQHL